MEAIKQWAGSGPGPGFSGHKPSSAGGGFSNGNHVHGSGIFSCIGEYQEGRYGCVEKRELKRHVAGLSPAPDAHGISWIWHYQVQYRRAASRL